MYVILNNMSLSYLDDSPILRAHEYVMYGVVQLFSVLGGLGVNNIISNMAFFFDRLGQIPWYTATVICLVSGHIASTYNANPLAHYMLGRYRKVLTLFRAGGFAIFLTLVIYRDMIV